MRFGLVLFALSALASPVSAQVVVVEQEQASAQIVERGYVRGQGRGIQYGAHLVSPIYVSTVEPARGRPLDVSAGLGVLGRIGWEFPSGFTLEVFGGLAANGVTRPPGRDDLSDALLRAELGGGLRYMFFNDTALVPFVQVGASFRWFWFDYLDPANMPRSVHAEITGALHGAVGFQIELTPFFGIEAGCAVDYAAWADIFAEPGVVSVMPFLGVTLYVYDERGN